jgi:hypothetical protein
MRQCCAAEEVTFGPAVPPLALTIALAGCRRNATAIRHFERSEKSLFKKERREIFRAKDARRASGSRRCACLRRQAPRNDGLPYFFRKQFYRRGVETSMVWASACRRDRYPSRIASSSCGRMGLVK